MSHFYLPCPFIALRPIACNVVRERRVECQSTDPCHCERHCPTTIHSLFFNQLIVVKFARALSSANSRTSTAIRIPRQNSFNIFSFHFCDLRFLLRVFFARFTLCFYALDNATRYFVCFVTQTLQCISRPHLTASVPWSKEGKNQ